MEYLTAEEKELIRESVISKSNHLLQSFYTKKLDEPIPFECVEYFYKRKTKYPERVYLFFGREWLPRNRRPMGLQNESSFFIRSMTREEAIRCMFLNRLLYYQYEHWEDLINDEEESGVDASLVEELMTFQNRYHLPVKPKQKPKTIQQRLF